MQYGAALWFSHVLPGGTDRHTQVATAVLAHMSSNRTTNKGRSSLVRRSEVSAVHWLLEALTQAESHFPPLPLALPRSPIHYTNGVPYPVGHGYSVITRALNALKALQWIDITSGTEQSGYSRIRPAGTLLGHCRALAHAWVHRPERDVSRLLFLTTKLEDDSKDRRPLTDDEAPSIAAMRANLLRINRFLRSQCIHLRAPDSLLLKLGEQLRQDSSRKALQYGQVQLYRTFSSQLGLGGRFYGGWWQNLPRTMRPFIWINEWQGLECDFSGMAVRCLYAEEGLPIPDDPYDIGLKYHGPADARRDVVKEYVNSTLNDKRHRYRPSPHQLAVLGISGADLRRRVHAVHAGIAHHFNTDAGLRMQRVDAEIAERVLLRLLDLGAACLPIHDSFIVQAPFAGKLVSVMEECFTEVTGAKARLKGVDPVHIPHYNNLAMGMFATKREKAIRDAVESEFERFSVANSYFTSWADQMWGEEGWANAMQVLEFVPPFLLSQHAFPLPLLRNKLITERKERTGHLSDLPACLPCSSSFPVVGMTTDDEG